MRIDRRGAPGEAGGPFLTPTSDATLPEGTEGSAEWGDCESIEVDFASRAYGIEAGPDGAAATVFIGSEATAPTLLDVLSILSGVLPTPGPSGDGLAGAGAETSAVEPLRAAPLR